jgi:hypothetical protein
VPGVVGVEHRLQQVQAVLGHGPHGAAQVVLQPVASEAEPVVLGTGGGIGLVTLLLLPVVPVLSVPLLLLRSVAVLRLRYLSVRLCVLSRRLLCVLGLLSILRLLSILELLLFVLKMVMVDDFSLL